MSISTEELKKDKNLSFFDKNMLTKIKLRINIHT